MSVYEELNETQQFACRVIADHARSTAFAIADGILPGNEGRNYVLRKKKRRAIYHGREHLGLKDAFFYKVCDRVVEQMHGAFPELETQRDFIGKMVRIEEERFGNTLIVGLRRIEETASRIKRSLDEFETAMDQLVNNKWDAHDELYRKLFQLDPKDENGQKKAEEEYEARIALYPGDLKTEFLKLIFTYKIPPFLFRVVAPNLKKKYGTQNNPLGWFLAGYSLNDNNFELDFSRELINFIDRQGDEGERHFLADWIADRLNNQVTENMFRGEKYDFGNRKITYQTETY